MHSHGDSSLPSVMIMFSACLKGDDKIIDSFYFRWFGHEMLYPCIFGQNHYTLFRKHSKKLNFTLRSSGVKVWGFSLMWFILAPRIFFMGPRNFFFHSFFPINDNFKKKQRKRANVPFFLLTTGKWKRCDGKKVKKGML